MKYQFKKYPMDIILFLLWSIILLPIVLLNIEEIIRIIIGLPILFFIPGYFLIFILFPTKNKEKGITGLERIGLSFGFSIAIVSLLGFTLNFTPLGIQLISVLLSLFFITESLGVIALYRWITTDPEKRFTISVDISQFKYQSRIEKILTIFVSISIVLGLVSIAYIIVQPKDIDGFTYFYILNPDKDATNFPQDILAGQDNNVILGLINHEYKTITYTIEVWLIDESSIFNETTQKNDITYNHAWFIDKVVVTLNHTEITNDKNKTKKWEYNYTFTLSKFGYYKLAFLLFTTPSEVYDSQKDYKDSIYQKIKNSYRELHLWFYVG